MQRRVIFGAALILFGVMLLLVTTGLFAPGPLVFPVMLVLTGILLLHHGFRSSHEISVFVGTFLLLTGVFLVLRESVLTRREMRSLWPIFMSVGGVSLITYGLRKGRQYRLSMVLPGAVVFLLSLVFLLFSIGVIEQSLASITVRWWPVLFVFLGLVVLLAGRRERSEPNFLDEISSDEEDFSEGGGSLPVEDGKPGS